MASRINKLRYAAKYALLGSIGLLPRIRQEVLAPEDSQLYVDASERSAHDYSYPERTSTGKASRLDSCLCTEAQLTSPAFRYWIHRLGAKCEMHRKLWEHGYVVQSLFERGMLEDGKRGLVFAVGQEPLPALFASFGCQIVATDLDAADERSKDWIETDQHATAVESLYREDLCDSELFSQRVTYRPVDMNVIPSDLVDFDFTWSTCSFEHLGSIELGLEFLYRQMDCLKPGGVAVHTTEFNLTSNDRTQQEGKIVIFRRRDIEEIVHRLRRDGHEVEPLNVDVGQGKFDRHIDRKPFCMDRHLRLQLKSWAVTSIGLIIRKSVNDPVR